MQCTFLTAKTSTSKPFAAAAVRGQRPAARGPAARRMVAMATVHRVQIEQDGVTTVLDVPDGTSVLDAALDTGLELPHDCKMGVCMTCPAKVVRCGAWLVDWEPAPWLSGWAARAVLG